eukprot:3960227-Amphidinium_carterae.1
MYAVAAASDEATSYRNKAETSVKQKPPKSKPLAQPLSSNCGGQHAIHNFDYVFEPSVTKNVTFAVFVTCVFVSLEKFGLPVLVTMDRALRVCAMPPRLRPSRFFMLVVAP